MKITPLDIQQQQFSTRFRGFDIREVDAFLEQVANVFESCQAENNKLVAEMARLRHENKGYKEREENFKRAILNSHKVMELMKVNARKSCDLVIAEAEIKAEKIVSRANNRLAQLHEDIAELKRQRMEIEIKIRSVIEAHARLLDMGKEEATARDEVDAKVKLLKNSP